MVLFHFVSVMIGQNDCFGFYFMMLNCQVPSIKLYIKTCIEANWSTTQVYYCVNPKTVNTRIIPGMLLCYGEKASQMQDQKTAGCNGN